MLLGRAAFLLLFSLCGLEPFHDGGLFAGFGGFDRCGLVLLRAVVDDPINHAVVILHRHLRRLEVVFLLKSCHPAFLADTEHSALCRMIGNLFGIYAQALGVIGIETVNLATLLQSLLSRLLTGGKNTSPCVAVVLHILNGERGIGHRRHFLDLKVEKAERVIVKAVVDIIENELAALIDNDAGSLIAVGSDTKEMSITIDAVQENLDNAVDALNKLIEAGDAANAEALEQAINDLTAAYQAADDLLKADIQTVDARLTALKLKLVKADEALQTAIDTVQKNLNQAISDLSKPTTDGDTATMERLNAAIAALIKACKTADELLNSDIKALEASTKENLDNLQAGMEQELHSLRIIATVGLCISILAAVGNIVLLILYIRKKVGLQTVTK